MWRPGRLALWGAVGAVVASAHVAAAAWALRQHVPVLPAPPDAIEIELAPPAALPPAPGADSAGDEPAAAAETAASPAEETSFPAPPSPAADFSPPALEPLPPPDLTALAAPVSPDPAAPPPPADVVPPPMLALPPADFAALAATPPQQRPQRILDLARQQQPQPRAETERRAALDSTDPQPNAERKQAQSKTERRKTAPQSPARPTAVAEGGAKPAAARDARKPSAAQGDARKSAGQGDSRQPPREARSGGAQGGGRAAPAGGKAASAGRMASWESQVRGRIAAHMNRTNAPGVRGTVSGTVLVTIQPNGRSSARIAAGSGDARADAALKRQAARLPRLPPPPGGQPVGVTIPFRIKR